MPCLFGIIGSNQQIHFRIQRKLKEVQCTGSNFYFLEYNGRFGLGQQPSEL